jgi:hypothetical protein
MAAACVARLTAFGFAGHTSWVDASWVAQLARVFCISTLEIDRGSRYRRE